VHGEVRETLSVTKKVSQRNMSPGFDEMILRGESRSARWKTCPNITSPTTNPHRLARCATFTSMMRGRRKQRKMWHENRVVLPSVLVWFILDNAVLRKTSGRMKLPTLPWPKTEYYYLSGWNFPLHKASESTLPRLELPTTGLFLESNDWSSHRPRLFTIEMLFSRF